MEESRRVRRRSRTMLDRAALSHPGPRSALLLLFAAAAGRRAPRGRPAERLAGPASRNRSSVADDSGADISQSHPRTRSLGRKAHRRGRRGEEEEKDEGTLGAGQGRD
jgi:hypothetical protein